MSPENNFYYFIDLFLRVLPQIGALVVVVRVVEVEVVLTVVDVEVVGFNVVVITVEVVWFWFTGVSVTDVVIWLSIVAGFNELSVVVTVSEVEKPVDIIVDIVDIGAKVEVEVELNVCGRVVDIIVVGTSIVDVVVGLSVVIEVDVVRAKVVKVWVVVFASDVIALVVDVVNLLVEGVKLDVDAKEVVSTFAGSHEQKVSP